MKKIIIIILLLTIGCSVEVTSTRDGYKLSANEKVVTDSGVETECKLDTINGRQYFICRTYGGNKVITPAGR